MSWLRFRPGVAQAATGSAKKGRTSERWIGGGNHGAASIAKGLLVSAGQRCQKRNGT
jgi:hypothetical protein